jgi:hypothetical protein
MKAVETFRQYAERFGVTSNEVKLHQLQAYLRLCEQKHPTVCGMSFNRVQLRSDDVLHYWDMDDFGTLSGWATAYDQMFPSQPTEGYDIVYVLVDHEEVREYTHTQRATFFAQLHVHMRDAREEKHA